MSRLDTIVSRIKRRFGYPLVPIELPDDNIVELINESLEIVNHYGNDIEVMSVNTETDNRKLVKLDKYSDKIVRVLTADDTEKVDSISSSETALVGGFGGYMSMSSGCRHHGTFMDRVLIRKAYEKLETSSNTEIAIDYVDKHKIILSEPRDTLNITYIKKWNSVDDIGTLEDVDYVTNHAYYNCAILIGRARKKYTSQKSLHEIDSSMLDDAEMKLSELMQELKDRDDMLINIVAI